MVYYGFYPASQHLIRLLFSEALFNALSNVPAVKAMMYSAIIHNIVQIVALVCKQCSWTNSINIKGLQGIDTDIKRMLNM